MADPSSDKVVTDVTVQFYSPSDPQLEGGFDPLEWHRIEKDLHLHAIRQSAWLYLKLRPFGTLSEDDLVVTAIEVGDEMPGGGWECRCAGIWIRREKAIDAGKAALTDVNVLFGTDAVDPRPDWNILSNTLSLHAPPDVPGARLSLRSGRTLARPEPPTLKANEDGKFRILQVSDFHMIAGPGICKDAIDADGKSLPSREADPLTVGFLERLADSEKPDLVVITGDQLDELCEDAQTGIFKSIAPFVDRSIPFAMVFGNHDDEGPFSLSRAEQMSLLEDFSSNLSIPGPSEVDGVGNYHVPIYRSNSQTHFATLFFLDSHGSVPTKIKSPDYAHITQSQASWLLSSTSSLPEAQNLLAFFHIPVPEFGSATIHAGTRGEPTEGPSFNSCFYHALAEAGVVAVGTGHDHVNDFCALQSGKGPWLCHAGGAGFGGYGSYNGQKYWRRARIWELNAGTGDVNSWVRREYSEERHDEILLVENGEIAVPAGKK